MSAPERLGRYRLLHPLSRGGMGEVYLARIEGPAGFAKTVVVKRMLGHLLGDERAVEMFVREAQLAASLSHPNLVQVFELGEEGGEYFIAMEYVHGPSLRSVQKRLARAQRRLEPDLAASLVAQALRGLHHAHGFKDNRGGAVPIVHGDVSPENLLLGFDGLLKVTDFGVARALLGPPMAAPQPLRGKALYMAPEVRRHGDLQPASDVYSAAVVLFELLVGAPPSAPSPWELLPQGPLRDIVERGLSVDPDSRFKTAAAMADALDTIGARDSAAERSRSLLLELYGPRSEAHPAGAAPWLGGEADDMGPPVMASAVQGTQQVQVGSMTQPHSTGPRRGALLAAFGVVVAAAVIVTLAWPNPQTTEAHDAGLRAAVVVVPPLAVDAGAPPAQVVAAVSDAGDGGDEGVEVTEELPAPAELRVRKPRTGPGFISVRANPWAEVRLGAQLLGVTPLARVKLSAGRHTLRLSHPPSGTERLVTVTVRSGRESIVKADLTRR